MLKLCLKVIAFFVVMIAASGYHSVERAKASRGHEAPQTESLAIHDARAKTTAMQARADAEERQELAQRKAAIEASQQHEPSAGSVTRLTAFNWKRGGFNTVMVVERITIKNTGKRSVENIVIGCDLISRTGVVIHSFEFTIFEKIEPGKSGTFRNISAGYVDQQAASATCGVRDADYAWVF